MHNLHNDPKQRRGSTFGVMTFSNNPIKQLTTGAQLHNKMDGLFILISSFKLHNIRLSGQMVHYLYLSPHVFNILLVCKLPFGNRLACKGGVGGLVGAKMSDSKLTTSELFPDVVRGTNVFHRPTEDGSDGGLLVVGVFCSGGG